jgi:hypothetical protein
MGNPTGLPIYTFSEARWAVDEKERNDAARKPLTQKDFFHRRPARRAQVATAPAATRPTPRAKKNGKRAIARGGVQKTLCVAEKQARK